MANVDAVMYSSVENAYYFFAGNQYFKTLTESNNTVEPGYPKSIVGNWGVPNEWSSGIDAAMYSPAEGAYYFFKGG